MRRRLIVLVAALALLSVGCSHVQDTAAPHGLTVHLDQARVARQGREVFLRVHNPTRSALHVLAFRLTSARFDAVDWSGDTVVDAGYEHDLTFDLPLSRCGSDLRGRVRLTYRLGDGPERRSDLPVDDRYGTVGLAMDRDCARTTFERAGDLVVGSPRTSRIDGRLVMTLPLTLSPTGRGRDVVLEGFESTVLLSVVDGSAHDVPVVGERRRLDLRAAPDRCDAHALAEDKVGTLFGVRVRARGLPEGTSFYLPISRAQRTALHHFYAEACGLD